MNYNDKLFNTLLNNKMDIIKKLFLLKHDL